MVNRLRGSTPCWCGSRRKFKRCHGDQRRLRRAPLVKGQVSPMREVPPSIVRPEYLLGVAPTVSPNLELHSGSSLERLRVACRVAAEVLETVGAAVRPGITTDELDRIAHEAYVNRGAYPSPLGYKGFPKSICTSVNEVICHGIPDDRPLATGDVVNVDVTAYIEGMHGDTSATFPVGKLDFPVQALVDVTREALLAGVKAVAPGRPLRVVGEAIQPVAHAHGLGVVREYGGHGIGKAFHAAPHINHFIEPRDRMLFEPGMTLTIEPMLTSGSIASRVWDDGWTVVADDLLPTAQFEHTVIVTETGSEILTLTGRSTSSAGSLLAGELTSPVQ